MNIILWIIQVLLAALFIFAGVTKFVMPVDQMAGQTGLPGSLFWFIGAVEILGGLGLVLPGLFRIRPGLTPLAGLTPTIERPRRSVSKGARSSWIVLLSLWRSEAPLR